MKKRTTKTNLKWEEVKRMKRTFLLLVLMLMLGVGTVYAYPIATGSYNGLFFDNAEVLLDNDGTGSISIGDTFWGTAQIQTIKDANGDISGNTGSLIWAVGGGLGAPAEITAYFATDVVDIGLPGAPLTVLGNINHPTVAAGGTNAYIVLGPAAIDPNSILVGGEVFRIYQDTNVDYNDGSQATALATATDGALHSTLGMSGGYWYSIAPAVPPGIAGTPLGISYAGLNYISVPFFTGVINDPNESFWNLNVDMFFNSEIGDLANFGGPNAATLMHYLSNDPAVQLPIPEHATFLLIGAGLLGVAALRRKTH